MKRNAAALLVLLPLLACAPRHAVVPAQSASCITLPSELNGYRQMESQAYADASLGRAYRFQGPPDERVTVYVYPIGADVRMGRKDAQEWVAAEGEKFKEVFPAGVQRGWWQKYVITSAQPDPVSVDTLKLPGFLVAGVTRSGTRISVELEYIYAMCDQFLKVRGTLSEQGWTQSGFPKFAKALAGSQVRGGQAR